MSFDTLIYKKAKKTNDNILTTISSSEVPASIKNNDTKHAKK